jgi:Ca2+-binding EF-hand superfamily protein
VFAFDLYDKNAKGRLAVKEVTEMFREILGSKALEQEHTQR